MDIESKMNCPQPGHEKSNILCICTNWECKRNVFCCINCLLTNHTKCNDFMVEVCDFMGKNSAKLKPWFKDAVTTEMSDMVKHL